MSGSSDETKNDEIISREQNVPRHSRNIDTTLGSNDRTTKASNTDAFPKNHNEDDFSNDNLRSRTKETFVDDINEPSLDKDRLRCAVKKFMTNTIVDNFFLTLIVINSIMMGISTFDFVSDDENTNNIFFYCDLGFLIIFTVESILTVFYLRRETLSNGWVLFDTFIIIVSWISSATVHFDPAEEGASVQVFRSLRMFRILNKVEALRVVMVAISRSLARLFCLSIFCFVVMFIFAIYFTEQFRGMYEKGQTDVDYFSRLDWTFLTLYQLMTLDNWMYVTDQIRNVYSYAWIPIIIYVSITAFVISNLAIAIICDSIFELHADSSEDKVKSMTKNMKDMEFKMYSMCHEICDHLNVRVPSSADPKGMVTSTRSIECDDSIDDEVRSCDCTFRSISECRISCGKIINNDYVQGVMVFLVIANAFILALGTFSFARKEPAFTVLETINDAFLIVYTVEIGMQFIYHGLKMFKDGWHTFDFLLILLSWVLSLSSAFRVFRVLRLIHILPKFEAMRVITGTLYSAIPRISAVVGILLLFFYISAVVFTMLFSGVPVGGENGLSYGYFARLDKSLLSLFQIMTMENWAKISREMAAHVPWAPLPISAFLTISGLLFVNAIVALICQANEMIEEAKKEKKQALKHGAEKSYEERVQAIKAIQTDIIKLIETIPTDNTTISTSRLKARFVDEISNRR